MLHSITARFCLRSYYSAIWLPFSNLHTWSAILTEWWQQRIAWWELINAACQIIWSIICIRKQHSNHMEDDTFKRILQDKQSIYRSKKSRRKLYRMCWKEKIQWQSVTNGLRKEHVLRYPFLFLDKVLHFFFLMVICNSLNLLLKSLPINIINCIKFYVNCSALIGAYDWQ